MAENNQTAQIAEYSIEQVFATGHDQYTVPLYQREYAWGRKEIERLLNDLFLAFRKGDNLNYYLGSFVVRRDKHSKNQFELVDGQQRLITLSILFALYLNDGNADKVLRFQLRDDADKYIDACYGKQVLKSEINGPQTDAFSTATGLIRGFYPETLDEKKSISGKHRDTIEEVMAMGAPDASFKDYLLKHVILFRIELPESTDVNSYFEIMNNRGEQLKYHEIMKAELLAKLERKCQDDSSVGNYDELAPVFDDIWTACSRMNGYVGHHLHACSQYLDRPEGGWTDIKGWWEKYQKPLSNDVDKSGEAIEQSVIWDFANFLMHALKSYQRKYIPNSDVRVTLDERDMQVKYESLKDYIDPVSFLDHLIRLRLKFDKYVVKSENNANGDVEAWCLSYVKKYSKSYDTVNTFEGDVQAQVICLESMLQVSFNTQRNKDWLQYVLELDDAVLCDGKKLLEALKGWARARLAKFKAEKEKAQKNFYCLGLESSRFMLNLTDYLMWENHKWGCGDGDFAVPGEFVFKYLNSVEHHHPQHDDQTQDNWTRDQIDDIGNLFLVYSSENSSMSNHEPREKKRRYQVSHGERLPDNPKRYWMYSHTEDDWTLDDMKRLSKHVRNLIEAFLHQTSK